MPTALASPATDRISRLYRTMQIIRQTEEELARCHQRGLVLGACHTYVGEEAIASGVCAPAWSIDPLAVSCHGPSVGSTVIGPPAALPGLEK